MKHQRFTYTHGWNWIAIGYAITREAISNRLWNDFLDDERERGRWEDDGGAITREQT